MRYEKDEKSVVENPSSTKSLTFIIQLAKDDKTLAFTVKVHSLLSLSAPKICVGVESESIINNSPQVLVMMHYFDSLVINL